MSVFYFTLYPYREDAYWYFIKKSCLNVVQETIWMCWWEKSFWHTDDDDDGAKVNSRYFKTYSSLLFDVVLFGKWWWFSCSRISKDCIWFFTKNSNTVFSCSRPSENVKLGSYVVVVQRRQRSVQKSVMRMQSSIVFFVAVVVVVVAAELPLEPFLSRDQPLCKLIGTKERLYIRKRFNPHRTGLEHGRRYVGWKCRIRKEWGQQWDNFLWINTFKTQNFDCGKWRAKWPNFILNGQPSFGNPFIKVFVMHRYNGNSYSGILR